MAVSQALMQTLVPAASFSASSSRRLGDEKLVGQTASNRVSFFSRNEKFAGLRCISSPSRRVKQKKQRKQQKEQYGARAAGGGAGVADERGSNNDMDSQIRVPNAMMVHHMKKGYGAFGGGATLEKSKLDLSTSQTKSSPQIDLGGGGGKNGNKNANGGGDGGDDGGDDDDYMGGPEDDGDGDDDGFLRRGVISELFDRETVEAILSEWFKSIKDLPAGMKQALELGLISSAQMARFMSVNARPTVARAMSRLAPQDISRAFIGRMVADPAFIYKAAMEQVVTIGSAVHWEVQHRGERLKDEWDLALVNVMTLSACNAAIVWSLAPSRTYGTIARYDWQNMIQKLPNHMFDKSYPLREFNMQSRVGGFLFKAAQLSLVGSVAGAAGGALSNALVSIRKQHDPNYRPSVSVPSTGTSALALGAFLGVSGNLRYQLLGGADRWLNSHLNQLTLAIFGTTVLRCANNRLGEPSRLTWLGLDQEASAQSQVEGRAAYRRPSSESHRGMKIAGFEIPALPFSFSSLPFLNSSKSSPAASRSGKNKSAQGSSSGERQQSSHPKRKVKRKVAMAQ